VAAVVVAVDDPMLLSERVKKPTGIADLCCAELKNGSRAHRRSVDIFLRAGGSGKRGRMT